MYRNCGEQSEADVSPVGKKAEIIIFILKLPELMLPFTILAAILLSVLADTPFFVFYFQHQ